MVTPTRGRKVAAIRATSSPPKKEPIFSPSECIDLTESETTSLGTREHNEQKDSNEQPIKLITEEEQLAELTHLLATKVIRRSPAVDRMRVYAEELLEAGLHSQAAIVDFCRESDVDSWAWMRGFHKDMFKEWLQEQHASP